MGSIRSRFSRREFLKLTGGAAAVAAMGPSPLRLIKPSTRLSGELKILLWSHFVPQFDVWYDAFAQNWGAENGVTVTVDHINQADLGTRTAAEISAGEGHDLIEEIFPPAQYEPSVLDLTDVNTEAQNRFGAQVDFCTKSSFNPTTNKFYGFCHGWVPDPGDYRKSLWDGIGMGSGPTSWQELLDGGKQINDGQGIHMGIGMSDEIDSNMAARALIWSFGGSIQDENQNVVFNSPETVAAVAYMKQLYETVMTDEVFGWNAASNNQLLIAGQASYILNSISAYRTAQASNTDVADDIYFSAALSGPAGAGIASSHVIPTYIVPSYAKNVDAAKEFLLHLAANYDQATFNSKLYNFPAFANSSPTLMADGGWLDVDPFGSRPVDKLALLKTAQQWTTNVGHPGPASPAEGEVFSTNIIPEMMASAARGDMTPDAAVADAETKIKAIFDKWRQQGLVGGG